MLTGKTGATGLPTIRNGPWPRLKHILERFTARPSSIATQRAATTCTGERAGCGNVHCSCSDLGRSAVTFQPLRPIPRFENVQIRYLALGTPSDRKAFTTAIRAFALAGRWGDHLTLIGYGRHRRRLEKWSAALRIDAVVTFAEADWQHTADLSCYDTVILLSQCDERNFSLMQEVRRRGLRIISMSRDANIVELIRNRELGFSIAAGDVLALSHAMLTTPKTEVQPQS